MNVLAEKLAEFLEVGAEKALELYPILRGQFIAYQITNVIGVILLILMIISISSSVWAGGIFVFNYVDYGIKDTDTAKYRNIFLLTLKVSIPVTIAYLLNYILQILLSPDLMLFKQLL